MTTVQELIADLKSVGIKFNADRYLERERRQIELAFEAGSNYESLCRRGFQSEAKNKSAYLIDICGVEVPTSSPTDTIDEDLEVTKRDFEMWGG